MDEGDTLSIESNRSHSGKYWCLAENGLNVTVNASANLDVLCKFVLLASRCFGKKSVSIQMGPKMGCRLPESSDSYIC